MASSKIPLGNRYDFYHDNSTGIYFYKTNGVVTIDLERSTLSGMTYNSGDKIADIPDTFLPRGNGISFREALRGTRLFVTNTTSRKGLYAEESTGGYNIRGGVTYVTD